MLPKTFPNSRASLKMLDPLELNKDHEIKELQNLLNVLERDLRESRKVKEEDKRKNQEFLSAVGTKQKKLEQITSDFCEHQSRLSDCNTYL